MAPGFTFSGKLETTSFPEIAGAVYRLGKSGELTVTMGQRSRTIWFLDGNPVAVTSNDPRDHLARVLEESGKIGAEDAGRLEQVPEEKEALAKVDFVPKEVLTWGLKSRFVQLCYDTFRWTEGSYRFQEAVPPRTLPLLKVPTPTMILKGIAYLPPVYLRRRVPSRGTVEAGAVSPEEASYLSKEERSYLEACREGGEVGAIVGKGRDPEEARRQLFAFLALGLLSLRMPLGEPEPEAAETPAPPILDLTEEAIVAPVEPKATPRPAPEEPLFERIPPMPPLEPEPTQGELPYQGIGMTIAPPPAKRRSIFLPLSKRGLWLIVGGFGIVVLVGLWRVFTLLTTPPPAPAPRVPLTRVFPTPRATAAPVVAESPAAQQGAEAGATPVAAAPTAQPTRPVLATPTAAEPTAPARPAATRTSAPMKPTAPASAPPPQAASAVDRYREGLDVYRGGDVRKAADVWASLFAGGRAAVYTIQVEIACSAETVAKDFPALTRFGEPFVLPWEFKGRPCFLVCVGRFATKAEADAALAGLPGEWKGATVRSVRALLGG